jgi:hypothetical protein
MHRWLPRSSRDRYALVEQPLAAKVVPQGERLPRLLAKELPPPGLRLPDSVVRRSIEVADAPGPGLRQGAPGGVVIHWLEQPPERSSAEAQLRDADDGVSQLARLYVELGRAAVDVGGAGRSGRQRHADHQFVVRLVAFPDLVVRVGGDGEAMGAAVVAGA